jgi:hypothetical protein
VKAYTFFNEDRISELPQDNTTIVSKDNKCHTHIILNTKDPYLKQIKPSAHNLNTLTNTHLEKIAITPPLNYTTAPA